MLISRTCFLGGLKKRPNKRLQPTWPRLSEKTLNIHLYFPAKIVIR
jgi:hypothetical protein